MFAKSIRARFDKFACGDYRPAGAAEQRRRRHHVGHGQQSARACAAADEDVIFSGSDAGRRRRRRSAPAVYGRPENPHRSGAESAANRETPKTLEVLRTTSKGMVTAITMTQSTAAAMEGQWARQRQWPRTGVRYRGSLIDRPRVEVTRRLFQIRRGEYRSTPDVPAARRPHLLMDTGLGAKAYAIIGRENRRDLSSRPTNRRQLIEEAAGVTMQARRRSAN